MACTKYTPVTTPKLAHARVCLGATSPQVAAALRVQVRTLRQWMRRYPALRAAMLLSAVEADALVEDSLFRQATGFHVTEVTVRKCDGKKTIAIKYRYVRPNVAAAIFWVRNRMPARWGAITPPSSSWTR